jgi:hypothetical protein
MDIRNGDATDWSHRVDRLDCYAIGSIDLARYAALIVTPNADQEHLARQRRLIRDFLDRGGVVVFGGHLHRDWLPGVGVRSAHHPIFRGMGTELTFRRGVAGFFARGHHPPPVGAEILTRLFGGEPATYLDRVSTAGTIVVQATSDLLSYCGEALVDWIIEESAQRRAQAAHRLRGLAAVYGGSAQHHRTLTEPKYAQHLTGGTIYLPELADTDLTAYCGLLIPERLHRGQLDRAAHRILELLDAGGTVIAFSGGEPIPEFMPGVHWQHRPTNFWWWLEPDADLGVRLGDEDDPLFQRLTLRDCTWHYHGVLHPPEGAHVLVKLTTGEALLYVDRISTPGTVVVSTLDPISHYGGYFMPATGRFLDAFLPWAAETSMELTPRPWG